MDRWISDALSYATMAGALRHGYATAS